jgi:hypothetical protein
MSACAALAASRNTAVAAAMVLEFISLRSLS